MKKVFLMFAIVFASMCVVSCSSDDEDSGNAEQGIRAKDLIGTWWISKSRYSSDIGITETYNSDGTRERSNSSGMYNWELVDGKLVITTMSGENKGKKNIYTISIKNGKLYKYLGDVSIRDGKVVDASESEVLERIDVANIKAIVNKDYFVGTWTRGVENENLTFTADGYCSYSVKYSNGQSHYTSGTWKYNSETREMTTTLYSNGWNWKIVSASKNKWIGDYGNFIFERKE